MGEIKEQPIDAETVIDPLTLIKALDDAWAKRLNVEKGGQG